MRQTLFAIITALLVAVIALLVWRYTGDEKPRRLADALPITQYELSNGMKIVVVENHRAPIVSHTLFVRVGAADDPVGKSGLAHYAEHMLFKGTQKVSGEEYDRRIAALGGKNNAYTTADFTAYYVNAPVEALEQVMALESDRFMDYAFTDAQAETELKVISEERRLRVDSNPASLLSEQMGAVSYLMHPYRIPIIGWANDIARLTPTDIRHFLERNYQPSNMVLMVAGDVTPTDVRRLAMRYWGPMKNTRNVKRNWPSEPDPIAARSVHYKDARVQQPQWVRSYRAPSFGVGEEADVIALGLVAQWLGGGRTGALYQSLVVEQKLAVDVSVDYYGTAAGPGSLSISAVPQDGVAMETLEKAIDAALAEALAEGPDAASVARAKTLYTASITYAQDGLTPVASYIGALLMIGKDEALFYALEDKVAASDVVQMRDVAARVFVPEASVTGWLEGKGD